MKNNKPFNKENLKSNASVEFGQELSLSEEARGVLAETKAGGLITKRLVELGEKKLMEDNNKQK